MSYVQRDFREIGPPASFPTGASSGGYVDTWKRVFFYLDVATKKSDDELITLRGVLSSSDKYKWMVQYARNAIIYVYRPVVAYAGPSRARWVEQVRVKIAPARARRRAAGLRPTAATGEPMMA